MSNKKITVEVISEDAIHYDSDILVLKYAQALYGLDKKVVSFIEQDRSSIQSELPKSGEYLVVDTPEGITTKKVIFIGTPRLGNFGYKEIREFGRLAISSVLNSKLPIKHISLTIHGAGFGLDEEEAFSSQLAGIIDAVTSGQLPVGLDKITFLERGRRRAPVLERLLKECSLGLVLKLTHCQLSERSGTLQSKLYEKLVIPLIINPMYSLQCHLKTTWKMSGIMVYNPQ